MASGISSVVVAGNLTRHPELNESGRVLSFGVAVNRGEKDSSGEWGEVAHFFEVKVLGNRAGGLATILVKGDKVTVLGDLVQERWESKEGEKRSAVRILAREVVLSGGKRDDAPLRDDTKDMF